MRTEDLSVFMASLMRMVIASPILSIPPEFIISKTVRIVVSFLELGHHFYSFLFDLVLDKKILSTGPAFSTLREPISRISIEN